MGGALRVALVGGPMYDGLYRLLDGRHVEVVVHADHPTLNLRVAGLLAAGERIDVLSTHAKYAPSQARWLRPLDTLLDPAVPAALAPRAVELCRVDGALLSVPRNIDVRVLWADRRQVAGRVPATWDELVASGLAFGFPGRESGLFGTFFEVVTALGGQLFDPDGRPTLATAEAEAAVATLVALARRAPADLPGWHYDDVDAALGAGRVALAAAWPGATAGLRRSGRGPALEPHPYLGGLLGVRSYAGCHAWAIPTTCGDVDGAAALVTALCGEAAGALEATSGAVCAHVEAFAAVAPVDEVDARRLAITRDTIASGMITYAPSERFPEVEDAGWEAIRRALRGACSPAAALEEMQRAAERVVMG
ncbi:MAG: extracellular solute-binding protein [Acidimicrobiales bacterium]|nr:extracellular solute-binding protein [Acidimicrobiales bacterium]